MELRTREILYTMVFFGVVIVVVFGFGLFDRRTAHLAAPGVVWTALLLAGTVSLNRTFEREREGSCLTGLVLVPGIAPGLFVGKMLANLLFLGVTMCVVVPLVLLAFQFSHVPNVAGVVAAIVLGALGYAVLGTLVGGMLSQVRMRAILLPLVLFPMVIPIFGLGVTATGSLLSEGDAVIVRLEVDEEAIAPGSALSLEVNGGAFVYRPASGEESQVVVAEALAVEIQRALEGGRIEGFRLSRAPDAPGLTLVSDPGRDFGEIDLSGLSEISRERVESPGFGYLPVLAALDLLMFVVSIWLFGKLLEVG